MVPVEHGERVRDAARSREAILDAAERLFAERGYEATRIQDVAAATGLSRETPRYFFGSKDKLYEAVLERLFEQAGARLSSSYADAAAAAAGDLEQTLRRTIAGYVDFLHEHPAFVRLVQWETLTGGRFLGGNAPHNQVVAGALREIEDEFGPAPVEERVQLLLDIVALCWAAFTHGQTLLPALGLDPADPAFIERRKRHVADLLLRGLGSTTSEEGT